MHRLPNPWPRYVPETHVTPGQRIPRNGKVSIGIAYQPPPARMSDDAARIQRALVDEPEPSLLRRLAAVCWLLALMAALGALGAVILDRDLRVQEAAASVAHGKALP